MIEIRFHGRGGQGARVASRIVGRAGFLAGLFAQDLSLFGAERRGAPILAFTRLSRRLIDKRGYVEEPDAVMVMDDSLLIEASRAIFHGLRSCVPVVVNTHSPNIIQPGSGRPEGAWVPLNLNAIALRATGHPTVSAAAAGCIAKLIPELTDEILSQAVRVELGEIGLTPELVEKNILAAREAFHQMPPLPIPKRKSGEGKLAEPAEALSFLDASLYGGAPVILRPGNAVLRHTGNWRVERPELLLDRCKRCFLCFLFCPEAAIALDGQNYPRIDYEHCKGCMICYDECPPKAFSRRLEEEVHGG